MLMALSLLVYTLGQRQLRLNLKNHQISLLNQLRKRTERSTLRWIFQCFQGIHVVLINGVKQIVNLTDSRRETLNDFSEFCQKYYFLIG
jgi:transposase